MTDSEDDVFALRPRHRTVHTGRVTVRNRPLSPTEGDPMCDPETVPPMTTDRWKEFAEAYYPAVDRLMDEAGIPEHLRHGPTSGEAFAAVQGRDPLLDELSSGESVSPGAETAPAVQTAGSRPCHGEIGGPDGPVPFDLEETS